MNVYITYADGRHEAVSYAEPGFFGSLLAARREGRDR